MNIITYSAKNFNIKSYFKSEVLTENVNGVIIRMKKYSSVSS